MPEKHQNQNSELREDLVTGDWVLIAAGRAQRAKEKWLGKKKRTLLSARHCVFEDPLKASGGVAPLLEFGRGGAWRLAVIPNKFPALTHGPLCPVGSLSGPYTSLSAIGQHEILITRDHQKNFSQLSKDRAEEVFRAFEQRYKALLDDPCVQYISIFQNWGAEAGASQSHPHFQIIGLPVIPPHVLRSLRGSARYFKQHQTCVHCAIIHWEHNHGSRVVFENQDALVVAPYASGQSFELQVYPKTHNPYFERESAAVRASVVEALRCSLELLKKRLNDPDYNLFIHTAPAKDGKEFSHYHWHIEIVPKTNIPAGFELGTRILINPVPPEQAARFLKTGK